MPVTVFFLEERAEGDARHASPDEDVEAAQVWGAVPAGAWVVLLLEQLEVWAQPVAGLQLCWALLATALVSWTWVFSSSPSPAANSPLAC